MKTFLSLLQQNVWPGGTITPYYLHFGSPLFPHNLLGIFSLQRRWHGGGSTGEEWSQVHSIPANAAPAPAASTAQTLMRVWQQQTEGFSFSSFFVFVNHTSAWIQLLVGSNKPQVVFKGGDWGTRRQWWNTEDRSFFKALRIICTVFAGISIRKFKRKIF